VANGAKATELGLAKARGEKVETAVDEAALAPNGAKGTKQALDAANYISKYSD
jgi:ribose transport system substrate-binding protein